MKSGSSGLAQGNHSPRGFEVDGNNLVRSSYSLQVVGNHIQSVLTGRSIYVFSPPEDPGVPRRDPEDGHETAIDEVLKEAAAVQYQAKANLGAAVLTETTKLNVVIPDDISSMKQPELADAGV